MTKSQEPIDVQVQVKETVDGGKVFLTHLVRYFIQQSMKDKTPTEMYMSQIKEDKIHGK
jgi:hypothetical protein